MSGANVSVTVHVPEALWRALGGLQAVRRPVTEGAAAGAEAALHDHFAELQRRPRADGLGHVGFWSGNRGNSIAEQIGEPVIADDGHASVSIDDARLAHKLAGGTIDAADYGHTYLTIPANDAAAQAPAGARSFETRIAWMPHPDGGLRPSLVAGADYARETRHRDGTRTRKRTASEAKANAGMGEVLYWLVKRVTHEPMPDALPTDDALGDAALAAARDAIDALLAGGGAAA